MAPILVQRGCSRPVVVRRGYLFKLVHLACNFISFQDYLGCVAIENLLYIWIIGKAFIWGAVSRACPCQSPDLGCDIWLLSPWRLGIELDIIFQDVVELCVQRVYLLVLWRYSDTDGSCGDHRGVVAWSPGLLFTQSFLRLLRVMHF